MDIRLSVKFKFEQSEYNADILILQLSASSFFYVVHLFDDWLTTQFSRRYLFTAKECKFSDIDAETRKENELVQAIQNAIRDHKYHPCD